MIAPIKLTNVAQVHRIFGTNLNEITDLDIDSNLSLTVENTENNVMEYLGQDNFSFAEVVMAGNIVVGNACTCLQNATNQDNGQFSINMIFSSGSGESWYIHQLVGLYELTSPAPPAAPTPFITGPGGFILDETISGAGISTYSLEGVHIDGQGIFVIVQNEYGITRSYRLDQGTCNYQDLDIQGPVSVCNTVEATYSVLNIPGATYSWLLDGLPIGLNQNSLPILWSSYPDGDHVISVSVSGVGNCVAPAILNVASGIGDATAISCIANVNVSLDENCRFVVIPAVLIAGQFNIGSPYQVVLMDHLGKTIPNATLTKEHIGKKIMAKLIDGCGGNSCWATILVEDKISAHHILPGYHFGLP